MVSIVPGEVAAAREEKAKGVTMGWDFVDLNNCIVCGSRPVLVRGLGVVDFRDRKEFVTGICQVCCSVCSMATDLGRGREVMDDWQRLNPWQEKRRSVKRGHI